MSHCSTNKKTRFWTLLNYHHQLSQLVTVHSLLNTARVDLSQVTFKFPTLLGTWIFTCHVLAAPFLTKTISLGFDPGQKSPATNPWGIGVLNSQMALFWAWDVADLSCQVTASFQLKPIGTSPSGWDALVITIVPGPNNAAADRNHIKSLTSD